MPSHAPPPEASRPPGPPKRKPKPGPAPKPSPIEDHTWAPTPRESNTKTWIAVFVLCAAMTAGVYYARPLVSGQPDVVTDTDKRSATSKKRKGKRKRRRGSKRRRARRGSSADNFLDDNTESAPTDEELWEDDDLQVEDRFRIGDVFEDHPDRPEQIEHRAPEKKFIPPPNMYRPGPGYRPTSKWAARNATQEDVVEISMSDARSSAPLTPSQIRGVLNARSLMSCYDDIARKVPEMKGRIRLKVQVEGNGEVSRVTITRSQLKSKMVEDCIVGRVRRTRFPRSKGQRRTRFETHFDFD